MPEKEASGERDKRSASSTPDTERLEHQLGLVASSRVGEDQVTWTIFSIFWAAQVLLVGVLFQGPQFPPHPVAGLIVSVLGLVMSTAWALTQGRSLMHLKRFEDLTELIEKQLHDGGSLACEHRLTMSRRFPGPRARTVIRLCCWGAALAWLVSVVIFICCVCRCDSN